MSIRQPSLEGLIEWLKVQDPDATYRYTSATGNCLLFRYFKSIGLPIESINDRYWTDVQGTEHRILDVLNVVALCAPRVNSGSPFTTYGSALGFALHVARGEYPEGDI